MADRYVYNQDGELGTLPEELVPNALEEGFSLETPEQGTARIADEKFGNRPIAAGAASAARQFTMGLSDPILTGAGLVAPETLKGLQDAPSNEAANIAGGVAGFGLGLWKGPLAALGAVGSGASNLLVRGAEGGLLKAAARGAVAGGVENTLYGLGMHVSEHALSGDPEINGERLLAQVGQDALIGAGLGGVFGGLSSGVGKLFRRAPAEGETGLARSFETPLTPAPEAGGAAELASGAPPAGPGLGGEPNFRPPSGAAEGPQASRPVEFLTGNMERMGAKLDSRLEQFATKHATDIQRGLQGLGIETTPEELVYRGLDIKKAQAANIYDKGLFEPAAQELLSDPRFAGIRTGAQAEGLVEKKMGEALERMDRGIAVFDSAANSTERFDGESLAGRVRAMARREGKLTTLNDAVSKRLMSEADRIEEQLSGATLSKAQDYRRKIDQFVWENKKADTEVPMINAMREVRSMVQDEIRAKAEQISTRIGAPEEFASWNHGMTSYGRNSELMGIIKDRNRDAALANRKFSLTDYIGGGIGGSLFGVPGAIGGFLINKWGRERLPFVMARALWQAEQTAAGRQAARGFQRELMTVIEEDAQRAGRAMEARQATQLPPASAAGADGSQPPQLPPGAPPGPAPAPNAPPPPPPTEGAPGTGRLGEFEPILEQAAQQSPARLFAAHALMWGAIPAYQQKLRTAGLVGVNDSPEEDLRAHQRSRSMDDLQGALDEHGKGLDSHVEAFIAGKKGKLTREPKQTPAQLQDELRDLSTLVSNPQALAQRVDPGGHIAEVAPQTAAQLSATATRALHVLQSAAPKGPPPAVFKGYGSEWRPDDFEVARYRRAAQAVMRPMSVMENLRRGSLSYEAAEALHTVYPRMAEEIAQRFLDKAHEAKLSYQQRIQLSVLMGQPLEPSLEPDMMAGYQQTHQDARQAASDKTVQASRVAGRKINLPGLGTPSQSLEENLNASR